jgi:hypothetical protein
LHRLGWSPVCYLERLTAAHAGAAAIGAGAVYIYKTGETPEELLEASLLTASLLPTRPPEIAPESCPWLTDSCLDCTENARKVYSVKRLQDLVDKELLHQNYLVNWSNTHECHPKRLYEPETVVELEHIVAEAHEKGARIVADYSCDKAKCW